MNSDVLKPVLETPLFNGLVSSPGEHNLYKTYPPDWRPNYKTWDPNSLKATWTIRRVEGNVRRFNDYPWGLDIKVNTVVIRLYCKLKKPSKIERSAADEVKSYLEKSLYHHDQAPEDYFEDIEGDDVVDREIRAFLTAPDCDRLVSHLMPSLRTLP